MKDISEDILDLHKKKIDSNIETLERYILNGKCSGHQEYFARISELMAYRRARDNFNDSITHYVEEVDELDAIPGVKQTEDESDE